MQFRRGRRKQELPARTHQLVCVKVASSTEASGDAKVPFTLNGCTAPGSRKMSSGTSTGAHCTEVRLSGSTWWAAGAAVKAAVQGKQAGGQG